MPDKGDKATPDLVAHQHVDGVRIIPIPREELAADPFSYVSDPPRMPGEGDGRAGAGNAKAATHGLFMDRLPAELQHLAGEMAEWESSAVRDEGAADDIPVRRRSLLSYRTIAHRHILQLNAALEQRGLVDRNGRLRTAWLSKLESLIGVAVKLDNILGLERRPKPVQTIAQIMAEHQERS